MLRTRILSALVLGPIALLAAWIGSWAFVLLALIAAALIGWEWSMLSRRTYDSCGMLLSLIGISAALFAKANPALAPWLILLGAGLVYLSAREGGSAAVKWAMAGAFYVSIPTLSLVWIREEGLATLLWLLLVVWATDIGAYAAGRLIGGPKLAPAISPNKTWAGLGGGMVSAFIVGALFVCFMKGPAPHWLTLGMISMLIAQIAQCGDFAESAMKRHFGAKDSSSIIPGHGGVMDRLDGLLAAAPVVMLLCICFGGGLAAWR